MKSNEEYVKSITPEDSYIRGCTDLWVYPNNDKSYGRKFVLDRNKNYVIPASYVKLASVGVVYGGTPSLSEPREDTISAMSTGFALNKFSEKGNYLVVRYLGGDRFLVPQIDETLFLDHTSFADPQPTPGVYKKVIESNWLAGEDFDEFAKANPLFIQGAGPIHWDFEIYDFTSEKDQQKLAEKGFHIMSTEELKFSFAKAHEKNSEILQEGYTRIQKRNQEDKIVLESARTEFSNMRNIADEISPRTR